jgi:uncharacterized protein (DUF1697 family)
MMAVALVRGVNVGGRAALSMAQLREVAAGIGLDDPRTYLQSGNLVFVTALDEPGPVGPALEAAIASTLGMEVAVMVRSRSQLARLAAENPFPAGDVEPRLLHVVFLAGRPAPERVAGLDPDRSPPDAFRVDGEHIYVSYPSGSGRSRLNLDYFERQLGMPGTARNWNTVTNLIAMMA